MRLVIVASGDFFSSYGGGQVYVKNLVDELIRQQEEQAIELSVVSFHTSFPLDFEQKEYKGIPLYEIHPNGNIAQLFEEIAPDVVHAHGEKAKVAEVCRKLEIRCVVTAHHGGILCPAGTLLNSKDEICQTAASFEKCLPCYLRTIRSGEYWYPLVKHLSIEKYRRIGRCLDTKPFIPFVTPIGQAAVSIENKLSSWAKIKENVDRVIAPSNAIADAMCRNGMSDDKIEIVPHGIPISTKESSTIPSSDVIRFYYVGRINYVKGIHVLLQAFSSIIQTNIELHLIGGAVGKAETRYMSRLKKKYGKDKRIVWHGKQSYNQIKALTKDYHCMIHPAIYLEVFGLTIAEALAQHKYVIATRCGGPEMQIHSEEDGILIAPNNVKEVADAIWKYVENPLQSKSQVQSIDKHVAELVRLYKEVI